MNKHFRFSGSTFREDGRTGSPCLCGLAQGRTSPGLSRSNRACSSRPRNCLLCGARSAKSAPIRRSVFSSARKLRRNGSTRSSLAALSTENFGTGRGADGPLQAAHLSGRDPAETKDDEEWSIQFRWLLADEIEPPVLIECCFAWVLSVARHGTGTQTFAAARGVRPTSRAREDD